MSAPGEFNGEGGPAFPRPAFTPEGWHDAAAQSGFANIQQSGMTVRQLYKLHAMRTIMELTAKLATLERGYDYPKKAADACGVYADAMIREDEEFRLRQKVGEERAK